MSEDPEEGRDEYLEWACSLSDEEFAEHAKQKALEDVMEQAIANGSMKLARNEDGTLWHPRGRDGR